LPISRVITLCDRVRGPLSLKLDVFMLVSSVLVSGNLLKRFSVIGHRLSYCLPCFFTWLGEPGAVCEWPY
jgi:hypothetical protein